MERIGAGILVVGVTLAGYAVRIFQEPKAVWVAGRAAGIVIALAGLVIWFVGARFSGSPHAQVARQRDQKREERDRERK